VNQINSVLSASQIPRSIPLATASKKRRLEFLDALRGLASVYVVLFHVAHEPRPTLSLDPHIAPLIAAGGSGVALFFVISTFSLFYTMPRHIACGMPRTSFYIHRFFRIAPLFFGWLALSILWDSRPGHVGHSVAEVLANCFLIFNLFTESKTGIVWASWTVGVEMLFYVVFPLIFILVRNATQAIILVFAALALEMSVSKWLGNSVATQLTGTYGFLYHLPIFALGALGYYIWSRIHDVGNTRQRLGGAAVALIGGGFFVAFAYNWLPTLGAFGHWFAMAFAYLLIFIGLAIAPSRLLINPLTCFFGTIIYSLYLAHPKIVAFLTPLYRHVEATFGTSHTGLAFVTCVVVTFAVAIPVAYLTYRFIEVPGIRMGRRVMDWLIRRYRVAAVRADRIEPKVNRPYTGIVCVSMRRIRLVAKYIRYLPCHPQWLLPRRGLRKEMAGLIGRVLDVGCADRWVEVHCSVGAHYIGLDLPVTGKGLYAARPNVFADAARLPLLDASVDAVVCLEVLEHVSRPQDALSEFARVLRSGGTMLFSMPFLYPIHDAPHDFQRLTEYGLRRDFDAAGFDIVRMEKRGHAVRTATLLLCLALVGGIYERRTWLDYLRMPFVALGVLIVNIVGAIVSLLVPDWGALGVGYEVEARRR
jgi:peptidoglycan/LPS O-acetylase OafA/YrhL/SAM-dependent methyltransferase